MSARPSRSVGSRPGRSAGVRLGWCSWSLWCSWSRGSRVGYLLLSARPCVSPFCPGPACPLSVQALCVPFLSRPCVFPRFQCRFWMQSTRLGLIFSCRKISSHWCVLCQPLGNCEYSLFLLVLSMSSFPILSKNKTRVTPFLPEAQKHMVLGLTKVTGSMQVHGLPAALLSSFP